MPAQNRWSSTLTFCQGFLGVGKHWTTSSTNSHFWAISVFRFQFSLFQYKLRTTARRDSKGLTNRCNPCYRCGLLLRRAAVRLSCRGSLAHLTTKLVIGLQMVLIQDVQEWQLQDNMVEWCRVSVYRSLRCPGEKDLHSLKSFWYLPFW